MGLDGMRKGKATPGGSLRIQATGQGVAPVLAKSGLRSPDAATGCTVPPRHWESTMDRHPVTPANATCLCWQQERRREADGEVRMIKVIKAEERHHADMGWLSTYWHFSFAEYYDPANMSWGALRVFNDDVIQPGQGFGSHPHRDMEIVTYVLEGELEHRDSQGNTCVLHPGEIQVMSAGTGIFHSESNPSKDRPVHLLQLWILPRTKGLTPRWAQRRFTAADRRGILLPVVSGGDIPGTLAIDQAATIYVSALPAGQTVCHQSQAGRRAYLFVIGGGLRVNGIPLRPGDQARIREEPDLRLTATEDAELILLDLP